jgi:hypothetical protein
VENLVQEFEAREEDGTVHILRVYQKIIDVRTRGNPQAVARGGQKRIVTANGESVTRLKRGRYKVVLTETLLQSDSPDAP